jgi:hypothetical protein
MTHSSAQTTHSTNELLTKLWRPTLLCWMVISLGLWSGLPAGGLINITPWVCGILLASVGASLSAMLWPLRESARQVPGFWAVLLSALAAPIAGIAFALEAKSLLSLYPAIKLAGLLWMICSMGAVLTLVVCRFILALQQPQRIIDKPTLPTGESLQTD